MMNSEHADTFAAFVVGAAMAERPAKPTNFLWFTGRYDTFTGITPEVVEPRLNEIIEAWQLTEHSIASVGSDHEHHRWSDAAGAVEVEWLVHNYTNGGLIGKTVTKGHCAPGGHDAPPNPPFAEILGMELRLSCDQPDPKKAEKGAWAGPVTSGFYTRHVKGGSTMAVV